MNEKSDQAMSKNVVDSYGWGGSDGPESCGYITPKVVELLVKLKAGRVLDLGSGNGALCRELARFGFEVAGVEYDAEGVRIARQASPTLRFYNYGVQDDPALVLATEAKFDAVVSTEVIEHLFSPHLLPQYASGLLKPGGFLVLTTPYHGYLKNLALSVTGKWDKHFTVLWHGGHIKFWSRLTLTRLLNDANFDLVEFHGVGRIPFLWKSMVLVARMRASVAAPQN